MAECDPFLRIVRDLLYRSSTTSGRAEVISPSLKIYCVYVYIYIIIYIYVGVDQNSFFQELPFLATLATISMYLYVHDL